MPYRDDDEALRARAQAAEQERAGLEQALNRARAALASTVAWMAGSPPQADVPWRSLHGGEPLEVTIVNEGEATLRLTFVSYDGREHDESTIIGGGAHTLATHTGHLWRLRDADGVVWQDYVRAGETRLGLRATSPT